MKAWMVMGFSAMVGAMALLSCESPERTTNPGIPSGTPGAIDGTNPSILKTFVPVAPHQVVDRKLEAVSLPINSSYSMINVDANPSLAQFQTVQERFAFAILDHEGYDSQRKVAGLLSCVSPKTFDIADVNRTVSFDNYFVDSPESFSKLCLDLELGEGSVCLPLDVGIGAKVTSEGDRFSLVCGIVISDYSATVTSYSIDPKTKAEMDKTNPVAQQYGDSWKSAVTVGAYLFEFSTFEIRDYGDFSKSQIASAVIYASRTDLESDSIELVWSRWVLGRLDSNQKTTYAEDLKNYHPASVLLFDAGRTSSGSFPSGTVEDFRAAVLSGNGTFGTPAALCFSHELYSDTDGL